MHPKIWHVLASRWMKPLLIFGPFGLLALAAIGYGLANWYGQRALDRHFENLREHGISTDAVSYFTGEAREEDDVFHHPAMVEEMGKNQERRLGRIFWNKLQRLAPKASARNKGNTKFARLTEYSKWGVAGAVGEKETARKLLEEFEPERKQMILLNEAFMRPTAVWPVDWETDPSSGTKYPSVFGSVLSFTAYARAEANFLRLEAAAEVGDGSREWVKGQMRMIHHLENVPGTMFSSLVIRLSIAALSDSLWEASVRGAFKEDDLSAIERDLAPIDIRKMAMRAACGELTFGSACNQVDKFVDNPYLMRGWQSDPSAVGRRLRGILWAVRPPGISAMKQVTVWQEMLRSTLDETGKAKAGFSLGDYERFKRMGEDASIGIAYDDMGGVDETKDIEGKGYEMFSRFISSSLDSEAKLVLLRTGIALERYRLKYGSSPEGLTVLVPEFLPAVLADPFDSKPLRYRRQADGSPWVWSIGLNGVDDGGQPDASNDKGDLIWITHPIPSGAGAPAISR
ncbi:MAG: hypothetical protein ABI162_03725 [Luteolibacter sp.]